MQKQPIEELWKKIREGDDEFVIYFVFSYH